MKNLRHYLISIGILITTILLYWSLSYTSKEFRVITLSIIHITLAWFIIKPFIKVNGRWIINRYLGDDNSWWDKRIERPRILFYMVYIIIVAFCMYKISATNDWTLIIYEVTLTALLINGADTLGRAIWKEEFRNKFMPVEERQFILEFKLKKLNKEEVELFIKDNEPNIDKDSINDFRKFLNHEMVENKIKWIGTSGKGSVTFTNLFRLIHSLIEGGEKKKLINPQKDIMLYYLIDNFTKFEKRVETELIHKNINESYSGFPL